MSRMKLVVLSLLAAFALSAVAASTASAVTHEFKVNGSTVAKGSTVEVTGQGLLLGQLEGEIANTSIHIQCNDAKGPVGSGNVLEEAGKAKLKAEFTACTVYGVSGGKPENIPSCAIGKGKIVTTAQGELGQGEAEGGLIKYTGTGTSEETTTFEIVEASEKAACSLGKFNVEVKGKQVCAIPSYGFESTIGEVLCEGAGSKLEMGKEKGTDFKNAKLYAAFGVTSTKGQQLGLT